MAQLTDTLVSGDERVTGMIYGTQAGNYATCSTPAATAAKVVTIPGFVLTVGVHVRIKFSANNTAATPTLNVSGTGAKSIKVKGNNLAEAGDLAANGIYEFVYDGTNWELTGAVCGKATTANYGYVQLATGDMNGAANVDGVAVSKNHTHSQYLPKSGGTMSGAITLPNNKYWSNNEKGIDANNSDIVNANSIYFKDRSTTSDEGLHFACSDATNPNYDSLWIDNGKICFYPNHAVAANVPSSSAQIVPRFPSSISDNQVVLTNQTTGALKTLPASSLSVGSATKATGDADGTNIKQNYLKATSGTKSLSFGSSTTIGTVNGSNVDVSLPSLPVDSVPVVNVDGQTTTITTIVYAIAISGRHHARVICPSNGGSVNISGTPTLPSGGLSFVMDVIGVRYISSNDFRYQLIFYKANEQYPYIAQCYKQQNDAAPNTVTADSWISLAKSMAVHGKLQDSQFTFEMPNQVDGSGQPLSTRNNTWFYNVGLRPYYNGGSTYWGSGTFWLRLLKSQMYGPSWWAGSHSPGIAFGGGDTKGVISLRYSKDGSDQGRVTFAAGNTSANAAETSEPVWWFHVQGKHNTVYTLPPMGTGDNANKYAINITGTASAADTAAEAGYATAFNIASETTGNVVDNALYKIPVLDDNAAGRWTGKPSTSTGTQQRLLYNPSNNTINANISGDAQSVRGFYITKTLVNDSNAIIFF